jgi:protein-S-isoprenylcysteine O-methyltransferase Ste14
MISETTYRLAFLVLLLTLVAMRFYFMFKVRRSGERLMPDEEAVQREGGRGVLVVRVVGFFALLAFLEMYVAGMRWIDAFLFPLPDWLRWLGFAIGLLAVSFWTWTQIHLDTRRSAQSQLTQGIT